MAKDEATTEEEQAAAVQQHAQSAGDGPSLEGRAEATAEAAAVEANAQDDSDDAEAPTDDASDEARENAEAQSDAESEGWTVPEEKPTTVFDGQDVNREERSRKREAAAKEEREALIGEAQDPSEAYPDQVLEVSDSDKKEIEEEYAWRARVDRERERHLRLYQLGKNPLTEDPEDEEAAEEVRNDPNFAALRRNRDSVQNLAEGKTEADSAAIRREQKRQADTNSQDDTLQRSNLQTPEESLPSETPDTSDLKANEVVDLIEEAETADEVDALAEGDERKTVQKAADKRKKELSE